MLSGAHHSYIDPPNMTSASTSIAQVGSSTHQDEFLFNTLASHVEEPDTPSFMQQKARRKFPHATIPYNYSSGGPTPIVSSPNYNESQEEVEGQDEVNYSQSWRAPFEHMLPRATSHTVPPLLVNSHQLPEGATNQAHQFMAQHNPSLRSLQIPLMHGPSLLNSH